MILLALALFAYVCLRLVFVSDEARPGRGWLCFAFLGCFLLVSSLGQVLLRHFSLMPDTIVSGVVKQGLADLHDALDNPDMARIVFVDGGSYPARGLDGASLAQSLSQADGVPTTVIQLSLPGANHMERISLQRSFFQRLGKRDRARLLQRDVVLMLEVQVGYDSNPLAQYATGKFTDRTYAYLSPSIAFMGFNAWRGTHPDAKPREALELAGELVSHAVVNAFGVGVLRRHAWASDLQSRPGYQPMQAVRAGFEFTGLQGEGQQEQAAPAQSLAPALAHFSNTRVSAMRGAFGDLQPRLVFYALPSNGPANFRHSRAFCAWTSHPCIALDDPVLVEQLDRADYWFDRGHLLPAGAQIYTDWLAQRLAPVLGHPGPGGRP